MRRMVIAGGGSAGWMAAATLARFLPQGWHITLVESDAIGTVGVGEATIPQIALFNASLGIDEADFLKATHGSFKLGIEFAGWGAPGESYLHAFGPVGRPLGLLPFHQYWLRARAVGKAGALGRYVFNEVAARAGRFGRTGRSDGPVPELVTAYHFDAGLYAAYLRKYAENRGVVRFEGIIEQVERDGTNGDITALTLNGERRVEGDLFIDCTGFGGRLIAQELGVGFDDWSRWLPCDRAWAVPCARVDPVIPYTRATARAAGWQWRIPLQHRTGNGHVFCSSAISEDEAAAVLMANLDGAPEADPRLLKFTTGKRKQFWAHNCVALGLASGFMEPLESTSIHLIQSGIARLLQFLPQEAISDIDRDTFNRLSATEFERIRDFLILHYNANGREGEPFWDQCRAMALPDTLAEKLALFRSQGQVLREADELFTEPGWVQVMIGQHVIPQRWHPLAEAISEKDLADFMQLVESSYARGAAVLPEHGQWLAKAA
ncbi:MAG: tryptophan halogenase family protein [Sphingopyxis sp.]|nr:tryptophan halogenase family protein [Sphingopyxis sp.]